MSKATEVYVSNGDLITLYHFADASIDYAAAYYGAEGAREAAQDFAGIMVQGIDPVEAGWELGGFDSLDQARKMYYTGITGDLVADGELYEGDDFDVLNMTDPEDCKSSTAKDFASRVWWC